MKVSGFFIAVFGLISAAAAQNVWHCTCVRTRTDGEVIVTAFGICNDIGGRRCNAGDSDTCQVSTPITDAQCTSRYGRDVNGRIIGQWTAVCLQQRAC